MKNKVILKSSFNDWISSLIDKNKVIGVQEKEQKKFEFAPLKKAKDLRLDYDVTVLPPKKYLQPPREGLLKFSNGEAKEISQNKPMIIIGVHPYDMHGINQMDKIFSEDNKDTNYIKRRSVTYIIGCDPKKVSDWSFWASMGSAKVEKGFDLWLSDIGERYFIEIGTKKGEELLRSAKTTSASKDDVKLYKKAVDDLEKLCKPERKVNIGHIDIPKLIYANHEHKIWEERARTCYSCGSCNLVCPTCYCFDVRDEMELNLKNGERVRIWDGCLLEEFAKVASGENFREERRERFRHRIFRKLAYMPEKVGELACVGCGRCSSVCLPDIADPVKIINELI